MPPEFQNIEVRATGDAVTGRRPEPTIPTAHEYTEVHNSQEAPEPSAEWTASVTAYDPADFLQLLSEHREARPDVTYNGPNAEQNEQNDLRKGAMHLAYAYARGRRIPGAGAPVETDQASWLERVQVWADPESPSGHNAAVVEAYQCEAMKVWLEGQLAAGHVVLEGQPGQVVDVQELLAQVEEKDWRLCQGDSPIAQGYAAVRAEQARELEGFLHARAAAQLADQVAQGTEDAETLAEPSPDQAQPSFEDGFYQAWEQNAKGYRGPADRDAVRAELAVAWLAYADATAADPQVARRHS